MAQEKTESKEPPLLGAEGGATQGAHSLGFIEAGTGTDTHLLERQDATFANHKGTVLNVGDKFGSARSLQFQKTTSGTHMGSYTHKHPLNQLLGHAGEEAAA